MTLLRTFDAFMRLWPSQSINHKKRRSTSCQLMVEQLETRDLLSASTLMAVADGPFTIDKNTPTTLMPLNYSGPTANQLFNQFVFKESPTT